MAQKLCFATIGATAGFDALVKAVLDVEFVQTLHHAGCTAGKAVFDEFLHTNGGDMINGVRLTGFDFKRNGLGEDMRQAKGGIGDYVEGAVVSHAGKHFYYAEIMVL